MVGRHFSTDFPDECRCLAAREGDALNRDTRDKDQADGASGARVMPSTTGVTREIRSRSLTSPPPRTRPSSFVQAIRGRERGTKDDEDFVAVPSVNPSTR